VGFFGNGCGSGLIAVTVKRLTPREREIAALVAIGESNRAIGVRLGVADQTVKNHLQHVYRKLGVKNRVHLVLRLATNSSGVYTNTAGPRAA